MACCPSHHGHFHRNNFQVIALMFPGGENRHPLPKTGNKNSANMMNMSPGHCPHVCEYSSAAASGCISYSRHPKAKLSFFTSINLLYSTNIQHQPKYLSSTATTVDCPSHAGHRVITFEACFVRLNVRSINQISKCCRTMGYYISSGFYHPCLAPSGLKKQLFHITV